MNKRYEALWYVGSNEEEAFNNGEVMTEEFRTRKEALAFYEKHKEDNDKYGWWITHRDADWDVIEDIIY